MGKITVKHYLNTKVQIRVDKTGDKYLYERFKDRYPVYVQITFNRKTTQFKSFVCEYLTIEEYEYFSQKEYEKIPPGSVFDLPSLIKEPGRIQKSIEFLSRYWALKDIENLKNWIEFLISHLEKGLVELCWSYIVIRPATDKEAKERELLYNGFNREIPLTDSLKSIKRMSNCDISEYIPKEDLILWKNISALLKETSNKGLSLIDFIDDYPFYISQISKIKNREVFMKEIEEMIKMEFM